MAINRIPVTITTRASEGTVYIEVIGEGIERRSTVKDGGRIGTLVGRIDAALRKMDVSREGFAAQGGHLVAKGVAFTL